MKFAFSTVSCPGWDFETVAARAKEYGYDGVEIRGFLNESILTAANPFLSDAAKVGDIFDAGGGGEGGVLFGRVGGEDRVPVQLRRVCGEQAEGSAVGGGPDAVHRHRRG